MNYKDRHEKFCLGLNEAKKDLMAADDWESAQKAIDRISETIETAKRDFSDKQFDALMSDVLGSIALIQKRDITRKRLCEMLDSVQESSARLITQKVNEQEDQRLRELFLLCAEHASEIAKIIGMKG